MSKIDNPVRGIVNIEIEGETYEMRLTWHGVAQVRHIYPDGYNLADPNHLAVIMSIAMGHKHPDMSPDRIMDLSPPLETAISAVSTMIDYAWWGKKGEAEDKVKEEESAENPPTRLSKATAA